jgi:hypothetical protein
VRVIHVIFALLSGILALLAVLLVLGGPESATGVAHGSVDGMSAGGDGLARLGGAGWLVSAIQWLTLLLIHALIALGVPERYRSGRFWLMLGIACAVSMAVWWGMYASYRHYLDSGEVTWLIGFPLPTVLMLFGVFLAGTSLCALYVFGFRRYVLTHDDEAAYEALRTAAASPRKPDSAVGGSDP